MLTPDRIRRTVLLILLAVAPLAWGADEEAPKLDPASWAPADAIFFVGVTDVGEAWEGVQKTAGYKMLTDPAMKNVQGVGMFTPVFTEFRERLAKALDVPVEQLKSPFKGPLALFATAPPGGDPNSITPGLVAGVGDATLMKQYYDNVVRRLKDVGQHETVEVGGHSVDVFKIERKPGDPNSPAGDAPEPLQAALAAQDPAKIAKSVMDRIFNAKALPPSLAMTVAEDRLVVADTADGVKAALGRQKSGKTLADADDYKAIGRHLKPVGHIRWLVNLPRLLELGKAAATGEDAESFARSMKMLGGEGLRSVVGHARYGASNYDGKFELLFLMSGERTGLAKILSMDNKPVAPPPGVTADTAMFVNVNLNVAALVDEIERMVRQNDPDAADDLRKALEELPFPDPQKPTNLRKEVIDHLVGPLLFDMSVAKPFGPGCARLLFSIGHKDQQALTRFLGGFQGLLTPRDAQGAQAFDFAMMPNLSVVPSGDRLYIGSTAAIDSALKAGGAAPLSESESWRRAARFVPEQAWLTMYGDNRRMFDAAIELSRKQDELMAAGPDPSMMLLLAMIQGFNADDPAVARKILSYQASGVMTISTTPEGVQLTSVTLRPSEE